VTATSFSTAADRTRRRAPGWRSCSAEEASRASVHWPAALRVGGSEVFRWNASRWKQNLKVDLRARPEGSWRRYESLVTERRRSGVTREACELELRRRGNASGNRPTTPRRRSPRRNPLKAETLLRPSVRTLGRIAAMFVGPQPGSSCRSRLAGGTNVRSPGGPVPRPCNLSRALRPACPGIARLGIAMEQDDDGPGPARADKDVRPVWTDDRSSPERGGQRGLCRRHAGEDDDSQHGQDIRSLGFIVPLLVEGWLWPDRPWCAPCPLSGSQTARPSPRTPSGILREGPAWPDRSGCRSDRTSRVRGPPGSRAASSRRCW
jgi:hypothetical protein